VKAPRPGALRLVTRARAGKTPKPPLGLHAWTPDAEAFALLLDEQRGDPRALAEVVAQLPRASSLAPGTLVVILGTAANERPFWRLFARGAEVPRAARCSALVARGYVDIGAGLDEATGADLAWGRSTVY
jgi:hypothetical protein